MPRQSQAKPAVFARSIPERALCIGCNYALRDLPSRRCPECGREFDPARPATMNLSGRAWGTWARRFLRPPLWPALLAVCALSLWTLWVSRLPSAVLYDERVRLGWQWSILGAAIVLFVIARRMFITRRQPPPEFWRGGLRRWRVLPLIAAAVLGISKTSLPFRAAFLLSRPALDSAARRMLETPQSEYANRTIGLFPVSEIVVSAQEVTFTIDDMPWLRWHVIYRAGSAPRLPMRLPDHDEGPRSIGGNWYLYETGWISTQVYTRLRIAALEELAAGHPRAQAFVPMLIESLRRPGISGDYGDFQYALRPGWPFRDTSGRNLLRPDMVALIRLGPGALPQLRGATRDPDPALRQRLCFVLARMGPAAAEAIPDLVRLLSDSAPLVREAAVYALGCMGPAARGSSASLLAALLDSDDYVRYNALLALEKVGVDRDQAAPVLAQALAKQVAATTRPATGPALFYGPGALPYAQCAIVLDLMDSLARLGRKGAPAVPTVMLVVEKPELMPNADGLAADFWKRAIGTLVAIGAGSEQAADALIAELERLLDPSCTRPDNWRLLRIAEAAAAVAPRDPRLKALLENAVRGGAQGYASNCAMVLRSIDPDNPFLPKPVPPPAKPQRTLLEQILVGEAAAHWAVRQMGPFAMGLVPPLMDALGSGEEYRRAKAAQALGEIGPCAVAAVPELLRARRNSNWAAYTAIGRIGPAAYGQAVDPLLADLRDETISNQPGDSATEALAGIGVGSEDLVKRLRERWLKARLAESENILRILGRIGPVSAKALPLITEGLSSPEKALVDRAWEALELLGPAAAAAAPEVAGAMPAWPTERSIRCVRVLAGLGVVSDDVIAALIRAVERDVPEARITAAKALGNMGPRAAAAVPVLEKFRFGDIDDRVSEAAAEALGRIRGTQP